MLEGLASPHRLETSPTASRTQRLRLRTLPGIVDAEESAPAGREFRPWANTRVRAGQASALSHVGRREAAAFTRSVAYRQLEAARKQRREKESDPFRARTNPVRRASAVPEQAEALVAKVWAEEPELADALVVAEIELEVCPTWLESVFLVSIFTGSRRAGLRSGISTRARALGVASRDLAGHDMNLSKIVYKDLAMNLLEGVHHVTFLTEDIDRLAAFYGGVFEVRKTLDMREEGVRHVFLEVGPTTVLHPFRSSRGRPCRPRPG